MKASGVILKDDRLVMLDDVSTTEHLVDGIKADKEHVCNKRPLKCLECKSKDIIGVEVMGSYDGILFWECEECEHPILRFREDKTEKYLQLAKGLWTNPNDWGYCPRSEFN
jgi:hypothetical protein